MEPDVLNETFDEGLEEELLPIQTDSTIFEQTTRSRHDGVDCMSITRRVKFLPDSDREIIHVAICPAMQDVPTVEAFVVSGHDARIRTTQCQKYGVRLEAIPSFKTENGTGEFETIIELLITSHGNTNE